MCSNRQIESQSEKLVLIYNVQQKIIQMQNRTNSLYLSYEQNKIKPVFSSDHWLYVIRGAQLNKKTNQLVLQNPEIFTRLWTFPNQFFYFSTQLFHVGLHQLVILIAEDFWSLKTIIKNNISVSFHIFKRNHIPSFCRKIKCTFNEGYSFGSGQSFLHAAHSQVKSYLVSKICSLSSLL